jgi:hypothetical protein
MGCVEVPMQTENSKFVDVDKLNSRNENAVDIFAIAACLRMEILDANYKIADLDAYLNPLSHLDTTQKGSLKLL